MRTGNRVAFGVAALRGQEPRPGSERAANFGTSKPLLFAAPLYLLINRFGWRAGALSTAILLMVVALPLAWLGAREPRAAGSQRVRLGWGACLPYLRNRSMLVMFAARFSCGVAFFQIAHLVALALSKGFTSATGAGAAASALLFGWLSDRYGRADACP